MKLERILHKFRVDILFAESSKMNIPMDTCYIYIRESQKVTKDRIIELIEGLKPHYRNNHSPEDAEFNKAINIMEKNIAKLKEE